ncbi:hypothetical protein CV102_06230 [Natronococcus pandeyae]|uniref:Uncharacterized protein n=1 Tax=Natronococcus pandeyae TaxID=2055836 RepID=A0A8J8Q6B8_9EURY|nr:hypothetical protein CV102_06230 [Natronococcus pandeyae]
MRVEDAGYLFVIGVIAMHDQKRVMSVCECCDSAYAANVLSDGSVQPIGTQHCSCGSERFRAIR